MHKISFIVFFVFLPDIQTRLLDISEDVKSHNFKLNDYMMLNKLKQRQPNSLEKRFLQKPAVLNLFKEYLSTEEENESDLEYSEERENRRIEQNRRIYEIAGARFSPLFEPFRTTTTENMSDI